MTDKTKAYDIVIAEEYGEGKARFFNVGVAFEREGGGMSIIIPPGISISGRASILPRRDKSDTVRHAAADLEDDIPY